MLIVKIIFDYFLRIVDCYDPGAVQRDVIADGVVDQVLGDVFAAESAIQSAHFEETRSFIRPRTTFNSINQNPITKYTIFQTNYTI